MSERLADTVAFVTGASSGIGEAIAQRYARAGAALALAGIDEQGLVATAESIDAETLVLACDVRETEMVDAAVAETVDVFGGLDIAVSNAGVTERQAVVEATDEALERVLDVNLNGAIRVARATLPELMERRGSFIAISSQLGQVPIPGAGAYCASKGGVDSLVRQLAIEHAPDGVRVNAIAPGVVETPISADRRAQNPAWERERAAEIPLGRVGQPAEIAGPALFLASEDARYVTGQVLTVDGGYVIG